MAESGSSSSWGRRHTLLVLVFLAIVVGYSDRVNISVAAVAMKEDLGWNQTTKGVVLSSFFVGYLAFMFVGGWLANRFGGRSVLGIAVLWWSAFTLLTPLAAATSVPVLIAARIGMGIGEAAMFPAAIELLGRWLPPEEQTRGIAIVNSGIPFGTVIGLLVTGWIVGGHHWSAAFYAFGLIGALWAVFWFAMTANDPHTDPRVPPAERALLAASHTPGATRPRIPWAALLNRRATWALVVTHFACTWTLYMLLSWLPSFFRDVQHVSIAGSGMLSAAPWLSMLAMTYVAAGVSDALFRRTGRLALTRKTIQGTGLLGSGALLLLAQRAGSPATALAIVCAATGLLGFCWVGYAPNFLDLAPRHSAVLLGFSNTFATMPGIVGVAVAGWLVDITGGYAATFALAAAVSALGALAFMLFGRADRLLGET